MAGSGKTGRKTGEKTGTRMRWGHVLAVAALATGGLCAQATGDSAQSPSNVNVWSNALFAGNGTTTAVVRGNCCIHGSGHLLGGNLLEGGIALEDAIDLSGVTIMRNNYAVLPAYLASRVPALETVNIEGAEAETLHAKLRIKNGFVGLNGNSSVGVPYTVGSTVKESVDGTYVTDGWSGRKTTPDGGRGIPADVYSDNGWNELYDCGNLVAFPLSTDDWRDPATGATLAKPGTGRNYTVEEYFTEALVANPANPADGIYTGNIVLNASATTSTGAFYWNATTNTKLAGSAVLTASPGPSDDYIKFDPSKAMLKMNGQIKIVGELSFSGGGSHDTINYSGRCALLATGRVYIDVNLLSCNNGVATDYGQSFPQNNCLGVMSKTDINVGTGNGASQLDLIGAFYAQGTMDFWKQTDVMGTVAATYFDNNQVPNFIQVPALADNLPLGMIGNYPIMLYPAPGTVSAAPVGVNDITWTWQDNSADETGFKVWSDPGVDAPETPWPALAANSVSWQQTGLTPNTQYTFQVAATHPYYDTPRTPPYTAWTLAATPKAAVVGGATAHALTVGIGAGDGNPANTEYVIRCTTAGKWVQADGTLGASAVWKTAAGWGATTVTDLSECRKYYFAATARNGAGTWSPGGPGAACTTLDVTPPTGTIVVNGGAAGTGNPNVTLSLTWSDGTGSGVTRMRFSDDGAHWTLWEPVTATKARTLPAPNGYKTVRVQFLDRAGNYSGRFNDYILLNAR